jgi:glyoxylase-like metal-dependent hydrolase (beta-lactamase superfamily II)
MSHGQKNLTIHQLFDYETWTYTYLLWDEQTKEAAIIDSVLEQKDRDLKLIQQLGLTLKYSMDTHIHADHITANGPLRQATGCEIVLHSNSCSACATILAKDGDILMLGDQSITVWHTPGHTNNDISFVIDGAVFTGDTMLIRDCGRTDFQLGDTQAMYHSLHRLLALPDNTIVYPGHDYKGFTSSSIGEEKQFNTRVGNGKSYGDFKYMMDNLNLPNPRRIDVSVPGNMACGMV